MSLVFAWDPRKARSNYRKHKRELCEAVSVFSNPVARIFPGRGATPRKNSARSSLDIPRRGASCWFALRSRKRVAFASSALAAPRGQNSTIMKNTSQNKLKAKRASGFGLSTISITQKPSRTGLPGVPGRDRWRSCWTGRGAGVP